MHSVCRRVLQRTGYGSAVLGTVQCTVTQVPVQYTNIRCVSSKYVRKPWPRNLRRRTLDMALKPILPEQIHAPIRDTDTARDRDQIQQRSSYDRALSIDIRWQLSQYRVMAVCQLLHVNKEHKQNVMRLARKDDIDMREWSNHHVTDALQNTPLSTLLPLFSAQSPNMVLLAPSPRSLHAIGKLLNQNKFMYLMVCVLDGRVLTHAQCLYLCEQADLDMLPAQTVALLQQLTGSTCAQLQSPVNQLAQYLQTHKQSMQEQQQHKP